MYTPEHVKTLRAATSIEILHAFGMQTFSLNFLNLFRGNASFGCYFLATTKKSFGRISNCKREGRQSREFIASLT